MEDYDDYLTSQGVPQLPSAAPPSDAMPQGAQDTTQVSGISVAPSPSSQQGMNYQAPDLAQSALNAKAALNNPAFQPQGGGANPGVWGLLPQGMQHGTLRNVLGALGDAFLVGSGHQAQYEPRMERQQEGLAFASHADHPELSNGLMAATGTPDAMKNVVSLQENQNNIDARKASLLQSQQYHQDTLDQRKAYQDSQTKSRIDNTFRQLTPQVGGMVSRATDAGSYATSYNQADAIAKRVGGPDATAETAFGLVRPEDWKPGMVQGTTAGQQMSDAAKAAQRGVSVDNNIRTNNTRVRTAGISANSKLPTEASQVDAIRQKVNAGQTLSAGDQAVWDKQTNIKKSGGASGLHSATTQAAGAGAPQQMTPQQAQKLPKGTVFIGTDGIKRTVH